MRASGRVLAVAAILAVAVAFLAMFGARGAGAAGADKIDDRAKGVSQWCAHWKGTASWNGTVMTCTGTDKSIGPDFTCDVGGKDLKCSQTGKARLVIPASVVAADGLAVAPEPAAPANPRAGARAAAKAGAITARDDQP